MPSILNSSALGLAALILTALAPATSAQTYSNNAAITIPATGTAGVASAYPSTITVSGVPGTAGNQVTSIRVRLKGLTHTSMIDVGALLVAPGGQAIQLLNRAGTTPNAATLTFDSASTTPPTGLLVTGTFAPSGGSQVFAAGTPNPPNPPYSSTLSSLLSSDVNGQWRLYIQDFVSGDTGSIIGGWEIEFGNFGVPITPSVFTYQGRLDGAESNGTIDARFTLWTSATDTRSFYRYAGPVTNGGITVANGVFSTPVSFGIPVPADRSTWLQIEVASPAGGPFVSLSPRQPLMPAPLASSALTASSVPWSNLTGQAAVTTGPIGSGWQLLLNNSFVTSFRGGMRLADTGFLEMTNSASVANPLFVRLGNNGVWQNLSDSRLKTDITDAHGNLAAALKLRPVNFRWKADGAEDFGLIAQEVRAVLPRLVAGDEHKDSLTLNYSQLSVVAIGAIQEQQRQIESLKADAARRDAENADLKARLAAIEAALLKPGANK